MKNDRYTQTKISNEDKPRYDNNNKLKKMNNKNIVYNKIKQKNILNDNHKKIIQNVNNNNNNNKILEIDNFQIKGENDKVNNFNVNKEIDLDYSKISNNNDYTKNSPKNDLYLKTNQDNFTIKKIEKINNNKNNNILRNKKYNNKNNNIYENKNSIYQNRKNKNIKTKRSDISSDKIKNKNKYTFQIDLKDLIKDDIIEKSQISPSKRYKNKKINNVVKYYKPFKFNLNDDY